MHSSHRPRRPLLPPPENIRSLLAYVQELLQSHGVVDAALEASMLVEHTTGFDRTTLLCDGRRPVHQPWIDELTLFVERRLHGEPVQYIIGNAWFYGRSFAVDPHVLIPRPETELLVEAALRLLPRTNRHGARHRAVDIGTGSGVVAVTIALENPGVHLLATDVSPQALRLARANSVRHGVADAIQFCAMKSLSGLRGSFELAVSNPPYVNHETIRSLQPEVRDYEPRVALDGGADGLDVIRSLVDHSAFVLEEDGAIALEVGDGQAEAVRALLERAHVWKEIEIINDYAGIPRIVHARRETARGRH